MDAAEQLLAIEQIKQLKARYFRCMDTKDWDGFARVFAPNAVLDVTGETGTDEGHRARQRTRSRSTCAAMSIRSRPCTTVTCPRSRSRRRPRPRGIWSMEDMLRWPEGSPIAAMHGYGHYHETYEKIDGQWRIASCKLTRLRVDADTPNAYFAAGITSSVTIFRYFHASSGGRPPHNGISDSIPPPFTMSTASSTL